MKKELVISGNPNDTFVISIAHPANPVDMLMKVGKGLEISNMQWQPETGMLLVPAKLSTAYKEQEWNNPYELRELVLTNAWVGTTEYVPIDIQFFYKEELMNLTLSTSVGFYQKFMTEKFGQKVESVYDILISEVTELVKSGHKIEAIRMFRNGAQIGLKEAKEAVDAISAGASLQFNHHSGCFQTFPSTSLYVTPQFSKYRGTVSSVDYEAAIEWAISNKRVLRISYTSKSDGNSSERFIEPFLYDNENKIMEAFCRSRKAMRHFSLSNINSLLGRLT